MPLAKPKYVNKSDPPQFEPVPGPGGRTEVVRVYREDRTAWVIYTAPGETPDGDGTWGFLVEDWGRRLVEMLHTPGRAGAIWLRPGWLLAVEAW